MADSTASFLGIGWGFPPAFSRTSACVDLVSGETDIRQSLWILLSTAKGERVMVPEYGCAIWQQVFRAVDTRFLTEIRDDVMQAILDWEPRVEVERVQADADSSVAGLVQIEIDYLIRSNNTRSNLVYPFYLVEGSLAAAP